MKKESIAGDAYLYTSENHTFGTDAYLLADFARPKNNTMVCDLCTGCGIISMLMDLRTTGIRSYGVEFSREACDLFETAVREQARSIRVLCADLKELPDSLPRQAFELVTVNPPYFSENTGYENKKDAACDARHESGSSCSLMDVCQAADTLLKYGGRLCVCMIPERLPDLFECMRRCHIEPKRMRLVQNKASDVPWLALVEGKKGGKKSLKLEPMLVLRDENNQYTDEIYTIYQMKNPNHPEVSHE